MEKMHKNYDNIHHLILYYIIELVSGEAYFSSDFTPLYTYITMS